MTFITLTATGDGRGPRLLRAVIAPERAMMLVQLTALIPGLGEVDLIDSPDLATAAAALADRGVDHAENTAFAFGGAILAPFANRLSGRVVEGQLTTRICNHDVSMPANGWRSHYAIHGLVLDLPAMIQERSTEAVCGLVEMNDETRWPASFALDITWSLSATALNLTIQTTNTGSRTAPIGIGWHPYFRIPSGDRAQARLHVPANRRVVVDNYQSVMPTGKYARLADTVYDFSAPMGAPLGDLFLDDCFVELHRRQGLMTCQLIDPAVDYQMSLTTGTHAVAAVQVYAPLDRSTVVIEPQFNIADPFGPHWKILGNGMQYLEPGHTFDYVVKVEISTVSSTLT